MKEYVKKNLKTINSWVDEGWEWSKPVSHAAYVKAKRGQYSIFLTPTHPVPHKWLGNLKGKKVLGLASGGGQQGPILTALGAKVTIFDFSQKQLDAEKEVAKRENYKITIVQGDLS